MKIIFRCDPALIDWLPKPEPAKAVLPAWLRAMAPRIDSEMHLRRIRTVKQCPPFVDAMAHGFVMPLPCDVQVERGRFSWDWNAPTPSVPGYPRAPLSFHVAEQFAGSPLANGVQSAIKFNSFWTIALEAGWSLMAVHPIHRDDLPFRLLSGLVDADRFNAVGINFPAIWTDPDFSGVLPRGTPIAQCYAVPREPPEMVFAVMTIEDVTAYEALAEKIIAGPGVYRKNYRRKSGVG